MEETLAIESNSGQEKPKGLKSFFDLADYFAETYPDTVKISANKESELLVETRQRDEMVSEKGLRDVLEANHVSTKNMRELGDGKWVVLYKEQPRENLPEGYALKGGAARHYLRESLGLSTDFPRDYDVVRLSEKEPYDGADSEIARRFMPKDFEFGDGVEYVPDLGGYFNTRDLTINEVLATREQIIATESAILDTLRNILRLTPFERNNYNSNGEAGPKMLAKLLRFYSEALQLHGDAPSILDIGHERIDTVSISPFWLAVNLDRAFERGRSYAVEYVNTLLVNNQLPQSVQTPEEAINYLLDCMSDESFIFRSAPVDVFQAEDEWVNQFQENEDDAISKIRRRIIKR
ncbi:MAG: hypothetical protein Q7S86_00920 [bacterium]|nr:hypothetical protein [bacterium]